MKRRLPFYFDLEDEIIEGFTARKYFNAPKTIGKCRDGDLSRLRSRLANNFRQKTIGTLRSANYARRRDKSPSRMFAVHCERFEIISNFRAQE